MRNKGKTRQQIEQLKELLDEGKKVLCYGLLNPSRYLDQLSKEYTAEEVFRKEFNIETEQEVKTLIGNRLYKI